MTALQPVCVDLCSLLECCWWAYGRPDACGYRCCGPYGPNLDQGCNLSERPVANFIAYDASDPPQIIWFQTSRPSYLHSNCEARFQIRNPDATEGYLMRATMSQGIDGGQWAVGPVDPGAINAPSWTQIAGQSGCGTKPISLEGSGGTPGTASFDLFSFPGECIEPPCGPADDRLGAAIAISGFADCFDDGPDTPGSCKGLLRSLSALNQVILVSAPANLPAIVDVVVPNFAVTCNPGSCQYNYEMRVRVFFDCFDPGDGDTLGYSAYIDMDGYRFERPNDPAFQETNSNHSAGIGCCIEHPAGPQFGYLKDTVNFSINWGFY